MTYTPAQRKANIKWDLENKEYMHSFILKNNKTYADRNRALLNQKSRATYHFKQECKRFRNILLEKPEKIEKKKLNFWEKIDLL